MSEHPRPENNGHADPAWSLPQDDLVGITGRRARARSHPRLGAAVALLVVLPVLAGIVGSALSSTVHPRRFTSESRLLVGGTDTKLTADRGYQESMQRLAGQYARYASQPAYQAELALAMRVPYAAVPGHLIASPLIHSRLLRVRGNALTQAQANRWATVGAQVLQSYILAVALPASPPPLLADATLASRAAVDAAVPVAVDTSLLQALIHTRTPDQAALSRARAVAAADTARADLAALQAKAARTRWIEARLDGSFGDQLVVDPGITSPLGDGQGTFREFLTLMTAGVALCLGALLLILGPPARRGLRRRRRTAPATGAATGPLSGPLHAAGSPA